MYFTDPFYKRAWWKHDPKPQDGKPSISSADHQPRDVTQNLTQPNGIIGMPDGRTLFVVDIGGTDELSLTNARPMAP